MIQRMIVGMVVAGLWLVGSIAVGQPKKDRAWTGNVAFGYAAVEGTASDTIDDDYILNGGAVYKPDTWPLGLFFDLAYSNHDIDSDLLDSIGLEGDIDNWTVSTGAMWSRPLGDKLGFYLQGGLSGHYLDASVTESTLVVVCDPWWWWCFVDEGDVVVASEDTTEFGYNAGVGLTFNLANDSQLYVEARYHWVETERTVEYMPIVFGYRW